MPATENEGLEVSLLLEAMYRKYGYDFRHYSQTYVQRRLRQHLAKSGLDSIAAMIPAVLHHPAFFEALLFDLSITVTEMFRDPSFYQAIRKEIVPMLRTYPLLKIWLAGCATGEEVYSLAILLKEEGLYDRTQIYATDFNEKALAKAREGIYPLTRLKEYSANYQEAGGGGSLSDYCSARYDSVCMHQDLRDNILFASHNLVTDDVFGEMQLICCRNVFIYFNRELQDRVVRLFVDSLCPGGFLALGPKESLDLSRHVGAFEPVVAKEKIYRKRYEGDDDIQGSQ